jgi:hypothetical protein
MKISVGTECACSCDQELGELDQSLLTTEVVQNRPDLSRRSRDCAQPNNAMLLIKVRKNGRVQSRGCERSESFV